MYKYDYGITGTTMYGHYNAYVIYKLKDGRFKVYKHTFTDSTLYDRSREWPQKTYEKLSTQMARKSEPNIFESMPKKDFFWRAF